MRKLAPIPAAGVLATLLALSALVFAAAGAATASAAPTPSLQPLAPAQQHYLTLAQQGVASAKSRWADHRLGWYDSRLGDHDRYPLATIWDIVPLFQSLDAIAIAQPTPANRAAVTRFAKGAERYLNRGLRPLPGYSPYPGDRSASTETWFDDNGWWGIALVNAYRATGSKRWLNDAARALKYVAAAGWDARAGGLWWNTTHPYKAGAALASDTLLATLLYQQTKSSFALAQARRFLAWGNTSGFSEADGLYRGSSLNPTPIDYAEGPLIYAQAVLCELTGTAADCQRSDEQRENSLKRFGYPSTSRRSTTRSTCSGCSPSTGFTTTARCTRSPPTTHASSRRAPATAKASTCSPGTAKRSRRRTRGRGCCRRTPPRPACSRGWPCIHRRPERTRNAPARLVCPKPPAPV